MERLPSVGVVPVPSPVAAARAGWRVRARRLLQLRSDFPSLVWGREGWGDQGFSLRKSS